MSEVEELRAEVERLRGEVAHWEHHAWEAGEGFKRAIESERRAWVGRRAAEAEVERLDAHYIDWQRTLQDEYRKAAETWDRQRARMKAERDDNRARTEAAEARLDALVADLRGLADELEGGTSQRTVQEWLDDFRSRLDKHAGEQPQPEMEGYWLTTKPPHGYTCGCPEDDRHREQREWVPVEEASEQTQGGEGS